MGWLIDCFDSVINVHYFSLQNSFESWRPVFFLGASVYMISAIFFIVFGTGNIQPWNFEPEDKDVKEDKTNGDLKDLSSPTIKNGDSKEIKETPLNVSA